MKDVYLKAAERIADRTNDLCCVAIEYAKQGSYNGQSEEVRLFEEFFKPAAPYSTTGWWPDKGYRDFRVLALCFMAAIAEAGDV